LRICLSASFTQYAVTITQVQESVSDFNPESKSGNFQKLESWESQFFKPRSRSLTKDEDSTSLIIIISSDEDEPCME